MGGLLQPPHSGLAATKHLKHLKLNPQRCHSNRDRSSWLWGGKKVSISSFRAAQRRLQLPPRNPKFHLQQKPQFPTPSPGFHPSAPGSPRFSWSTMPSPGSPRKSWSSVSRPGAGLNPARFPPGILEAEKEGQGIKTLPSPTSRLQRRLGREQGELKGHRNSWDSPPC